MEKLDQPINSFKVDLQYSLEQRENELFDNFYFRIFPHLECVELVTEIQLQMQGVDKKLVFKSGKHILIDEKKRRKDYGDILLEEYSNFEQKKKGWLSGLKITDYIIYAVMPSKKVFVLPFLILQLVWLKNYVKFLEIFGRQFAENEGYRTSNIAIPTEILLELLKKEMEHKISA